ncbi:MAG: hypothetical protein ABIH27_04170, partial [Candidatus Omnitrophota bacterium]
MEGDKITSKKIRALLGYCVRKEENKEIRGIRMKKKTRIIFYCLSVSFASLFFLASAQADLPGWSYNATVKITNSLASSLTDYQVSITINTAALVTAGKMQATGNDIRFNDSDDLTPLSYWIESGMNTTSTK